jgi:hypothetical protein
MAPNLLTMTDQPGVFGSTMNEKREHATYTVIGDDGLPAGVIDLTLVDAVGRRLAVESALAYDDPGRQLEVLDEVIDEMGPIASGFTYKVAFGALMHHFVQPLLAAAGPEFLDQYRRTGEELRALSEAMRRGEA